MRESEVNGICERCGAALKYPVEWQGHIYGSECIHAVTGVKISFAEVNGKDSQSVKALIENRQKGLEQWRQSVADYKKANALVKDRYSWLISFLIESSSEFSRQMGTFLKQSDTVYLDEVFSSRQLSAIADMYAKQYGKKGSKSFKIHREEFFQSVELEETA